MTKEEIINKYLTATHGENYLEIGVRRGTSIKPIMAKKKWGVDPKIVLNRSKLIDYLLKKVSFLSNTHFFEMTSDHFFKTQFRMFKDTKINVALIDGIHTYEQSLRDVVNCLNYLDDNGVIVMHDCNPITPAMAFPASSIDDAKKQILSGWTGKWCGDVWKTIAYLRSHRNDLFVCVLACDKGVGIIKRGKPESMLQLSLEQINDMSYGNLFSRREELLNLKGPEYIDHLIEYL